MSLRPYSAYKPSGLEWLGDVPEHWESRRAKFLFSLMDREVQEGDEIVTAFRDGEVTHRSNRRKDGFTSALKEIGYQGVRKGDLVIHAMDAFAGAIGVSDSDGKSTPVYSVCKPREGISNAHYYAHLLRCMALGGFINSLAKGIRERSTDFRWSDAGGLYLPLPPKKEQDAIVAFLIRETAKIDALIAEQVKLLALLAEKRQATISHAVTRGLNPNVPMKDSGIAWLGEVPAHWEVKQLRYLAVVETGSKDTVNAIEDGEFPFFVRSDNVERIDSFSYDCEAILTAGDGAGVGKVFHYFIGKFDAHQRVYVLHSFQSVTGKYLFLYLRTLFARVVLDGSAKSTVDSLRRPMFQSFSVTLPPSDEQKRIVEFLDAEITKLDELKAEAERGIELLKERRSALIAAAVTGKIDVRCA